MPPNRRPLVTLRTGRPEKSSRELAVSKFRLGRNVAHNIRTACGWLLLLLRPSVKGPRRLVNGCSTPLRAFTIVDQRKSKVAAFFATCRISDLFRYRMLASLLFFYAHFFRSISKILRSLFPIICFTRSTDLFETAPGGSPR